MYLIGLDLTTTEQVRIAELTKRDFMQYQLIQCNPLYELINEFQWDIPTFKKFEII